jgi:Ferritin-like domain
MGEQQAKLIEMLNRRLADAIDLQLQSRQAYWNVKGPHFMALRELFDKVAEGVEEYTNLIAERIVQLGGKAEGTATSKRFRRRSPTSGDIPAMLARKRRYFRTPIRLPSSPRSGVASTHGSGSSRRASKQAIEYWLDQLPALPGERARGELRETCRMAYYLERDNPRVGSALLKGGEMLQGLPKGSLHVTGGDRR